MSGTGDYISREAAIKEFSNNGSIFVYGKQQCEAIVSRINSIPAADVRPVMREKWTMHSDYPDRLICSECGTQFDVWHWEAKQMHFCPNCGADMREES